MRKFICIILAVCVLFLLCACGKEDNKNVPEETYPEYSDENGSLTVNETVARTLLEAYPSSALGLVNSLDEYDLKLSATRFYESDACLVEAYSEGAKSPEGTFVILNEDCYVFDTKSNSYLHLTLKGTETTSEPAQNTDETTANMWYDEGNSNKIKEKFDGFTKEQLGIKKELSEYVLIPLGTTTTASDGETVYVVRLYEKNGEATNQTVAFSKNGSYAFDKKANTYKRLK
ncbi:MAG: hypothetical protein ACI4IF_01410 [Acutalibacteraceae bacterium]